MLIYCHETQLKLHVYSPLKKTAHKINNVITDCKSMLRPCGTSEKTSM